MTDQVMMELAKMQSKIRAYEQNEKKNIEQLHLRDEEISQLKKKLDLLELYYSMMLKEKMIAKNKSYLEAKVQKDVDQIKENQKLQMKGKNDNQENSSSNRRKK